MTYEATIANVEKIISRLTEKDVPLDEAVRLYKEGMDGLLECRRELDKAKMMISEASGDKDDE